MAAQWQEPDSEAVYILAGLMNAYSEIRAVAEGCQRVLQRRAVRRQSHERV